MPVQWIFRFLERTDSPKLRNGSLIRSCGERFAVSRNGKLPELTAAAPLLTLKLPLSGGKTSETEQSDFHNWGETSIFPKNIPGKTSIYFFKTSTIRFCYVLQYSRQNETDNYGSAQYDSGR
ncbi:hypothetical protein ACCH66_002510 [Salmonella enterica]